MMDGSNLRWLQIARDTVEFTLVYDELEQSGVLMDWEEISELYDKPTTDILEDDFVYLAREFNDKIFKTDKDEPRLIQLQEFAKDNILKCYGKRRKYTVKALVDTVEINVEALSEEGAIKKASSIIEKKCGLKVKQIWINEGDEQIHED